MLSPLKKSVHRTVSIEENIERALNWIRHGYYKLDPLMTGIIPADRVKIKNAYAALRDNPDQNMCYLIDWENSSTEEPTQRVHHAHGGGGRTES